MASEEFGLFNYRIKHVTLDKINLDKNHISGQDKIKFDKCEDSHTREGSDP